MSALGPEWTRHPRRDGFYVDEGRPGYMRDRAGNWYVDPEGAGWWYRDTGGRIVYLDAPREPSAAERQATFAEERAAVLERVRRRLRELKGGER